METQKDSKSRDLSYDDDGNLSAVEEQMDLDDIPNPAKAALQKKAAGGTIKKIASVTARGTVSYEATIVNRSGGHTELAVNTNGSRRRD